MTLLLKGRGGSQKWEAALCGRTPHDTWTSYELYQHTWLLIIRRVEILLVIYKHDWCVTRSMSGSLRHSAASVLCIFSTVRTHWKLYSYTTKNTKKINRGSSFVHNRLKRRRQVRKRVISLGLLSFFLFMFRYLFLFPLFYRLYFSSSTVGCKREIVHHIPHILWW